MQSNPLPDLIGKVTTTVDADEIVFHLDVLSRAARRLAERDPIEAAVIISATRLLAAAIISDPPRAPAAPAPDDTSTAGVVVPFTHPSMCRA